MGKDERFREWEPPEIKHGELTEYNWLVQYPEGLTLGEHTDIGAFTYINARYGVKIGKGVQIGSHCSIYSRSTIDNEQGPVTLEENCCIGAHTVVMPGVTVGENAVVGAMSLVKSDIPADCIAYGVPAKPAKRNA